MPILDNPRHERFAQELASGKTADEAYEAAGFKPNRGNASTLKANQSISERVTELLTGAAVRAEVTIESIAAQLDEDRQLARSLGQASAAVSASVAKAKLYGLSPDKIEAKVDSTISRSEAARRIVGLLAKAARPMESP